MQKGFGLIVFIGVICILLLVAGGGFWLGRKSIILYPVSNITPQDPQSSVAPTKFTKRTFDPKREMYPGYSLPGEITNIAEKELVGFNCDGPYRSTSDGLYLWSLQLDGETYLKPFPSDLTTEVYNLNTYLKRVGYQQPAAYITYCLTETGGKYLLVGQPMPGGGAGSDTYIMDLNHGIGGPLSGLVKSEPWPYFGCSSILQITSDAMYVFCSAGDGGFSGQAVYKKKLSTGEVTPLIRCTNTAQPDSEQSIISCQ